jgi:uncharacterized protein (TIGR02265 family)
MSRPISGKLVDGVFRHALASDVSEQLRGELARAGLDLTPVALEPTYPREVWYRAVALTATALFPHDSTEEQLRRFGRHVVASLQARHVFRGPWLTMARLLGPRRALQQIAGRLTDSPVALSITVRGHSGVEVFVEEREQAGFLVGLLEAACEVLGAHECQVTVVEGRSPGGTTLSASWR